MNKIVNKFLLAEDISMPKLNLNNNQDLLAEFERIQKFRERNLKHIYKNGLNKACLAFDAAYSDSKKFS